MTKVRPYEDDDDDSAFQTQPGAYSPTAETPIQREIRLSSEREQLLRQSRGLQSSQTSTVIGRRSVASPTDRLDNHHTGNTIT